MIAYVYSILQPYGAPAAMSMLHVAGLSWRPTGKRGRHACPVTLPSGSWDATQHDRGLTRRFGYYHEPARKVTEKGILGFAHKHGCRHSEQSPQRTAIFAMPAAPPQTPGTGSHGLG